MAYKEQVLRNTRLGIDEYDIKNCEDTVQLLEWKLEIQKDNAQITEQLNAAKVKVISKGEYSDPDWYKRTIGAKKCQGMLDQMIALRLSTLKKQKIEQDNNNQENMLRNFLTIAQEELPEKTFLKLLKKAQKE